MTYLAALIALETEYRIYLARCASWGSAITPTSDPNGSLYVNRIEEIIMSGYDDFKTDPEYGLSHADLRMAEREAELQTEIDTLKFDLEQAEKEIAKLTPKSVPYPNDLLTDICKELLDLLTPEQIACFAADIVGECENIVQDRNEQAWEDSQNREPDDSKYRQDMKDAGRGHLLK